MSVAFKEIAEVAEQISQIEQKNQAASENLERIAQLEKNIQADCKYAVIADEVTQIQLIVDETNKLTERRKFYVLLQKVEQAILSINEFHERYQKPLPDKIFEDLNKNLEAHRKSTNELEKSINRLYRLLKKPYRLNNREALVCGFEDLARTSEGNLEFFHYRLLCGLEKCLREIKGENPQQKTHKSIRTSGRGFTVIGKKHKGRLNEALQALIEHIEEAKTFVISTQSAEAKAIKRIQNTEPVEWVDAHEPGQAINIDKINARLRQRGYTTQIPCEDSPTSQE